MTKAPPLKYDPEKAPDPDHWLSAPEDDRLYAVYDWHEESKDPVPDDGDWHAHSSIHVIVENQLALNDPPEVRTTLARLIDEGLDRHSAIHAIGDVFIRLTFDLLQSAEEPEFDQATYQRELEVLSADDWLAMADELEDDWLPAELPNENNARFTAEQQQRLTTLLDRHRDRMLGFPETAGFLFAMVSAPELVRPSEWLSAVLGEYEFESQDQAETFFNDLMDLNNWMIDQLAQQRSPLPPGCEPASEPADNFAEDHPFHRWTRGFCEGHGWVEEIWERSADDDESAGMALMCLMCFASRDMARTCHREILEANTSFEQMLLAVHQMIPQAFDTYYSAGNRLRQQQFEGARQPARSTKIGRNKPCPCGSGKKYKNCCGRPH